MSHGKEKFWSRHRTVHLLDETRAFRSTIAEDEQGSRVLVYEAPLGRGISATVQSRVKYEVQQLSSLTNNHLLTPDNFSTSDSELRLTFPAPDVPTLRQRFANGVSVELVLNVARDLLQALVAIHEAGLVCRCIRPRDIYLKNVEGQHQAVLIGCWPLMLLHDMQPEESPGEMLYYSAPETLGAIEHDVHAPADLYSLGLVLFECLVGSKPFEATTSRALLFHHVTTPLPEIESNCFNVPPELTEIIRRLLQKHPRDRYQSAAGVLHDIQMLEAAIRDGSPATGERHLVLGTKDSRDCLIEPAHVGRDSELSALSSELENVCRGMSPSVLVTASSGTGKSRLLQELATKAVSRRFRMIRAQGQNQLGLSPLGTLRPAIDECVELLIGDEDLRLRLSLQMQKYSAELHAAAPNLAAALQLEAHDTRDHELSDRRIAAALAILFGHVACSDQPVMFIVDDAQWADELTLLVLECWQLTSPSQTLLVVSTRPADVLTQRLKKNLKFSAELQLSALSRDNSDQLLESMAGALPRDILDAVWQMAFGNPFVSSAVLRGLVEAGVLTATKDGWAVDSNELRNLQMSGEAAGLLKQRLVRLPDNSRQFLAVGAVLGKEFAVETAAELAEMSLEEAIACLIEPGKHHLVWERDAGSTCQFVHDQIREAVLESLSSDDLKRIHLAAAEYLERTSPGSHFEIAHHFNAADRPAKALTSAVVAGHAARRGHALEIAEQLYEIAVSCCHTLALEPSFEVLRGLGDVLMLRGKYDQAQVNLTAALHAADTPVAEAEISLSLGELAFKRDEKDEAVRLWENALRKLGGLLPPDWAIPFHTVREIFVQSLHTVLPGKFVRNRTREASLQDRLICRLYSRLAYGYWYLKGKIPLLFVHLRGMNLAEGFAPTSELAQAYSEHAPAMSLIPLRRRGIAYGRRSLEIRTELEDVWGQGQSLHFLAIALYAAGRFEECVDVGRRSVRILERAGDVWEKHIAQYQVAASLYRMGRMTEAVQLAREAYDSGIAVGDDQVCANIIEVWARATNGDLPGEIIQRELQRERADVQAQAHVQLAHGMQFIAERRFEQAVQAFDEGIRLSHAAGISNCYTSPLHAWKATALRMHLEEDSPCIRRSRQRALRAHRRAARMAFLLALRFRGDLPHALRELAWSCVFQNRVRRGILLLKWSIRAARSQSARYEVNQSEVMLQQIRAELGRKDAAELLQAAQQRLTAFRNEQLPKRVPVSLSLADRFESLLESGRRIASAIQPEEIIETTVTASRQLLRSDFCRVVEIDDTKQPRNICESARPQILRSVKSGEPETADSPTKDHRSLITCPIDVRGVTAACLVVGNSEVRDLFGESECRIISYIATICGAAFENSEGFRELKQLNENLEQIVSERTATVEARSLELQKTADSLRQTQGDLAAARDAAEVANQAKTEFLAHMSHEIRTPIGAVLGFTELLLHGSHELHSEQRQHLERVHSNGSHLLQLLNDLLDLSRIEAGELTIEKIECKPFGLLSDILASLQSRAIDKGVTVSLEVTDSIPDSITTDPTRLRQIVTNLVGNAIKFTSEGSVDVIVETLEAEEMLKIHVQDSGVGIPSSAQTDVFEPFRQADESVNRRFGGTGLGLPISRRLARALGGDITLQSKEGVGSTFTATVATGPLHGVEMLTGSQVLHGLTASSVDELCDVDLSGVTILAADDTSANREFFVHTLCSAGAIVDTVNDGQQAVDAWKQKNYSLIVMDMRMPVMDGETAVRLLRQRGATVPIIALTANGMPEDELRCREAGCTGYLTKPISMDKLLRGVAEHLGRCVAAPIESVASVESASDVESPNFVQGPGDPESAKQEPSVRRAEPAVPQDPFFRELAVDLNQKLISTLPESFGAIERWDMKLIAEQAHWMKGTGGTVGLPTVTSLGAELERAAKAEDHDQAGAILVELQELTQQLQILLVDAETTS